MPNHPSSTPNPEPPRIGLVRGEGVVAQLIGRTLRAEGWRLAADAAEAHWLVHVTNGREADATPILAGLHTFAQRAAPGPCGGIVLLLDLSPVQVRAGEPPAPFAEALVLRSLQAAVPLLALTFAPRLRVNAIGILPGSPQLPQGTPEADIAAALRFVIDAPALTGQMIALDGGRTALVPPPGLGTSDQT